MSDATYPLDAETLLVDNKTAKTLGASFADRYQSGTPYHHICIDNFLPEPVLNNVLQDLETMPEPEASFANDQEKLKSSYIPERLPFYTRSLFYAFNSRPFILFLQEMTGIDGLIPDPYFMGAGIHRTLNGGYLNIHADFNLHQPMQLERRLNVLIYLNRDWKAEYGGSFEVWDKEMTKKEASFAPLFNRMVAFSTGSDTFHGNPEPVNHPNGEPRQSIALYYYTATWNESRFAHSTLFKPRPGTVDSADKTGDRRRILKDVLPPFLYRKVGHRLQRLGF
jgi:Rps23 Pro-64 3,4-dihydroxylase Tpa1-like proline 4-hydroxylase